MFTKKKDNSYYTSITTTSSGGSNFCPANVNTFFSLTFVVVFGVVFDELEVVFNLTFTNEQNKTEFIAKRKNPDQFVANGQTLLITNPDQSI